MRNKRVVDVVVEVDGDVDVVDVEVDGESEGGGGDKSERDNQRSENKSVGGTVLKKECEEESNKCGCQGGKSNRSWMVRQRCLGPRIQSTNKQEGSMEASIALANWTHINA